MVPGCVLVGSEFWSKIREAFIYQDPAYSIYLSRANEVPEKNPGRGRGRDRGRGRNQSIIRNAVTNK